MGDKYHFLATKLAATKMLENTNNWGDCANRNFPSVAVGVDLHYPLWKTVLSMKLDTGISYSPGFMLLEKLLCGVYTQDTCREWSQHHYL